MKKLTLREKIGQLIVTGFPSAVIPDEFARLVQDCKIGNVILFSYNAEDVAQLGGLCRELHSLIEHHTGLPAFISIDQEGGRVTRLPDGAANVPGAMAVASTGRPEHAYTAGRLTARELQALGINFNLAPVLDINNNKQNPVINVRSYGDTAETVEEYGLLMMKGLLDGGVLSALKHFPGHGDTEVDSHLGLPSIDKTLEQLEQLELRPFIRAIREGAESIMSAHILFPKIEENRIPATMSRTVITGILKERLGYKGLVVSDCLEMEAIKTYYGTAEGALGALKAGVHLVFISHTPALVREAVERIEAAVKSGELPEAIVDEAVEKVLFYKQKYRTDKTAPDVSAVGSANHRRTVEAISLESICLTKGQLKPIAAGKPGVFFLGCLPFRADNASSDASHAISFARTMGEAFTAPFQVTGMDPDEEESGQVLKAAAGFPQIVIGLYNGVNNNGQLRLANRLIASGHQVTAVALGKPYDLDLLEGEYCGLAAFDYSRLALGSLVKILGGEAAPTGRLSLTGGEERG
jgi:beta-N-acetylhexosaminidase